MSAQQREMDKLWTEMKRVEVWPARTEAEFKSKQKELARLKAAYERARGVASSRKVDDLVGKSRAFKQVFGGRPDHETRDSLEQYKQESGF